MPERGGVWQVDFGVTQQLRPALVIGCPPSPRATPIPKASLAPSISSAPLIPAR
jgi:hypothetical protein